MYVYGVKGDEAGGRAGAEEEEEEVINDEEAIWWGVGNLGRATSPGAGI